MRYSALAAALIVGLCLFASTTAASGTTIVSFDTPATFQGTSIISSSWVVLEFDAEDVGKLSFSSSNAADIEFHNYTWASLSSTTLTPYVEYPVRSNSVEHGRLPAGDFTLEWTRSGFVALRGDLEIVLRNHTATLDFLRSNSQPSSAGGLDDSVSFWAAKADREQAYGQVSTPAQVEIVARSLTAVEMLGGTPTCQSTTCPRGGAIEERTAGNSRIVQYSFERLLDVTGTGSFQGSALKLSYGGESLSLELSGDVRMPQAIIPDGCSCSLDEDSTLALSGAMLFSDVRPDQSNRLRAQVSGDQVTAFSDGKLVVIPQLALSGAAVTASVIGLAVVAKLLFALFTRLGKQEALEHPKRQKIFAYVQEHPGANFREVARQTHIAAGTVRHHLTVLERAGHLVEHQHNGTVRLFENHGKFDHNWADLVLLREPPLAQLHSWIKEHPGSPQKIILEAMEHQGWSRSTAQHRLARLVDGGLLTIRLQGRLKIYSAAERPAQKPGMILASGTRSPAITHI